MEVKKEGQNEEQKEPFQVNDVVLDLNDEKKENKIPKYLLIGGTAFFILLFIIALIIVNSSDKSAQEEEIYKIPLGEIICIFDINSTDNETIILGNEFEKNSDFSIVIDGKIIKEFVKKYSFSEEGEHQVKFQLYDDTINMENMFKNVKNLKSVDMYSNSSIKISSMISTFEKCELLNSFNIKGFDTKNITSLQKLFYNTSLSKFSLDMDTNNVEDLSYMFANTNLKIISLTQFNLENAKNMSYMFYMSDSLLKANLEGIEIKNVEDISHMFQSCKSLNEINLFNIYVQKLNNMGSIFKDCISLVYLNLNSLETLSVTDMSYMLDGCFS